MIRPKPTADSLDDLSGKHPAGSELHSSTRTGRKNLGVLVYRFDNSTGRGGRIIEPNTGSNPLIRDKVIGGKNHEVGEPVIPKSHTKPSVMLRAKELIRHLNEPDAVLLAQPNVSLVSGSDNSVDLPKDPKL